MLWQPMQPTLALAWGERSKFGCAPAWQLRHFASTSLAEALAGLKILVTSPPPSTCALPGAVAVLAGHPVAAVHLGHLGVGVVGEFLATSSWQVAQVSEPTKSDGAAALPWVSAVFPSGGRRRQCGGAQHARAQHQHQTSSQSRPIPGAAPISNRVTGLSLCMKNTAFGALIASSGNICSSFRLSNLAISLWKSPLRHRVRWVHRLNVHAEAALVRSITTCREDYGFVMPGAVMFITHGEAYV